MKTTRTLRYSMWLLLCGLICLTQEVAASSSVSFKITALGGDHYRYDYTVNNNWAGDAITGFTIYFDPTRYDESSLSIVSAPTVAAGWDQLILGSGIGLDAAYDVLALGTGVAPGQSVDGFAVEFTWLGTVGTPGVQPFDIYDSATFRVLESGITTVSSVPEPGGVPLFVLGIALIAYSRKRRFQ